MNWSLLVSAEQVNSLIQQSYSQPVYLFKHSTRCSISTMAYARIERQWNNKDYENSLFYYLDVLNHRSVSNLIEQQFNIQHESPQLLLIKNGSIEWVLNHSEVGLANEKLK